jgi:hypothetical protein
VKKQFVAKLLVRLQKEWALKMLRTEQGDFH